MILYYRFFILIFHTILFTQKIAEFPEVGSEKFDYKGIISRNEIKFRKSTVAEYLEKHSQLVNN
ncbi:hypothetical protein AOB57_011555 [Methanosarcina flavescens]|uniref:Uncharacterized protein n=1 Tax=Methanosarcina flavescens TaxID=1715806 RepID=A0A660HTS3_9EURY|nr:hypothetical protein AOB57_011555 [Methanosarcina flavescens]